MTTTPETMPDEQQPGEPPLPDTEPTTIPIEAPDDPVTLPE